MKLRNIKDAVAVLAVITLIIVQASCYYPKTSPGWEYMPDMAHSLAYDAYSENPNFADDMTSRQPVKGTVPLYEYECNKCRQRFEIRQRVVDDPILVCPSCGGTTRRVFHPVGIISADIEPQRACAI